MNEFTLWAHDETENRDYQVEAGSEAMIRAKMSRRFESGRDCWMLRPDGTKEFPGGEG